MSNFRTKVECIVAQIPRKKVMTYGQIAAICGKPRAARIVGGIAHYGNPELPWHRVVNKSGGMATGYPGGKSAHQQVMQQEGFNVSDYKVNLKECLWMPKNL